MVLSSGRLFVSNSAAWSARQQREVLLGATFFRYSAGFSVGTGARDHCSGSPCKNFQIQPQRPRTGIFQIQADHLVKSRAAATFNLPQSGDARLNFQYTAAVP